MCPQIFNIEFEKQAYQLQFDTLATSWNVKSGQSKVACGPLQASQPVRQHPVIISQVETTPICIHGKYVGSEIMKCSF